MARKKGDIWHEELGTRLAYLIKRAGKKPTHVGKSVGYSRGMMPQILSGISGIGVDMVDKIAKEIDCDPATISYAGHIPEEYIDMADNFFKLLRNSTEARNLPQIKLLIEDDIEKIFTQK